MEESYFGSEVATAVGLGNSTVRKYAIALEEQGYVFERGINNSRVFYNRDILMLQRIKKVMNKKGMTLERAIELAISSSKEKGETTSVMVEERPDEGGITVIERLERLEQLEKINIGLVKQLQEQQRIMLERDNKRDMQLTSIIREIQEAKKLTAVSQEEQQKPKKKWYEFWK